MEPNLNNFPKDLSTVDAKWIDSLAYREAEMYARRVKIKTNQLRNVFSHIIRIKTSLRNNQLNLEELKEALILLKPKLAYAKGRQKGRQSSFEPFQKLMFKAIDAVVESNNVKRAVDNFFSLVEAIIAYHKFHGGEDN